MSERRECQHRFRLRLSPWGKETRIRKFNAAKFNGVGEDDQGQYRRATEAERDRQRELEQELRGGVSWSDRSVLGLNIKPRWSDLPCRSCQMEGVRDVAWGDTVYYLPLSFPCDEHEQPSSWDPRNLPLRTHDHFMEAIKHMEKVSAGVVEKLAKYHGSKALPVFRRVGSMDFARSYPWHCMH